METYMTIDKCELSCGDAVILWSFSLLSREGRLAQTVKCHFMISKLIKLE